jgi:hypothetical protein
MGPLKYFRHAPFTAWVLITLALVTVLIGAWRIGHTNEALKPSPPAAQQSIIDDIDAIRTRMVQLPDLVHSPKNGLAEWARTTQQLADAAAARRQLQGAGGSDGIVAALQALSRDAGKLAKVDISKPIAVRKAADAVYSDADALAAIAGGARPDGLTLTPTTGRTTR